MPFILWSKLVKQMVEAQSKLWRMKITRWAEEIIGILQGNMPL